MDSLTPTTPRTGARRALVTLSFTLVALLGVGTLSPAQAAVPAAVAPTRLAAAKKPPAPRTVKVAKNSYGKFRLKWSKAKRAKGYRVIVARDKKMKKVVLRTKYTTKRSQWVHGKKIKEGVRYYVQVQSHASKRVKGKKSKPKAVRPLTKPVKKPEKLEVRATGLTSVRVTWKPAKYATGYTVKLRATKNGAPFWSKRVVGKSKKALNVKNINTKRYGNTFFVTVTADRKKRTFRDSETPIASTLAPYTSGRTVASGIKVASYNVQGHQTKTAWDARGDRIASIIAGRDIVGIQELTYGRTWGTQTRPIQDLARRAGLRYPVSPQGASCSINSVHVLHSSRLSVERCGSVTLAPSASRSKTTDKNPRLMAWVQLRDRSGERLLAVSTHLSNGGKSKDNSLRAAQARDLVAQIKKVNTGKLPVVVLGDLNSFWGRTAASPMAVLDDAGYLAADLFATKVKNGKYASTIDNGKTAKNRYRVDHVFTSRDVRIAEFEVRLASKPPSDHHPMFATLNLVG